VHKTLDELETDGLSRGPICSEAHFGPDAPFTTIAMAQGQRRVSMISWHEVFEQSPTCVATSAGVEVLNGRDREAVVAAEPESYRRFRRLWKETRDRLAALIPNSGSDARNLEFQEIELKPDAQ
jgi:hypothetical protein